MIAKKYTLIGLAILCAVQLWVAVGMIFANEAVLNHGTGYKFRTAPIDPNDPFRGKYIDLNFENNSIGVTNPEEWLSGSTAFASIGNDSAGFAVIDRLENYAPPINVDYLKVKINYITDDEMGRKVFVEFPFDRFYLEEKQAPLAEQRYREGLLSENSETYALVYIKEGRGVIADVVAGNKSLRSN